MRPALLATPVTAWAGAAGSLQCRLPRVTRRLFDDGLIHSMRTLYPPIEPITAESLDVGDGHTLYVEQCGRADGIPVIFLHGGPGGGCGRRALRNCQWLIVNC